MECFTKDQRAQTQVSIHYQMEDLAMARMAGEERTQEPEANFLLRVGQMEVERLEDEVQGQLASSRSKARRTIMYLLQHRRMD